MQNEGTRTPIWSGQIRFPWARSALLAVSMHPKYGLFWLQNEESWAGDFLSATRAQPMLALGALWVALMALSPWKSLRTDLTDTSLRG